MHYNIHKTTLWSLSKHKVQYFMGNILYKSPVTVFGSLIQFEIMLIIDETNIQHGIQHDPNVQDDRAKVYEGMNSDSEEEFKTTYEASDEDEDGDVGGEAVAKTVVVLLVVSQPIDVLPFMRSLDLNVRHAPEFLKYTNIGVADPKDKEFMIGVEYSFKKSVITIIRSYTISR
ncbi:hypothetical protein AHAS_Ahas07G0059700 [Arachis hypogaea]